MAPSTTARENCLANIASTLAALTAGADYNYTPNVTVRTSIPFYELLDTSLAGDGLMYFIEDGVTNHSVLALGGIFAGEMEVFITAAIRHQPDDPNPITATTTNESTIVGKLYGDIEKALHTTYQRGGAGLLTTLTHDAPVRDPDIEELEGWVVHEFRFIILYEYDQAAP